MDIPTSSICIILTTLIRSDSVPLHTADNFYGACQLFRSDLSGWTHFPDCVPMWFPFRYLIGLFPVNPGHTKSCLNLHHFFRTNLLWSPRQDSNLRCSFESGLQDRRRRPLGHWGKLYYEMYVGDRYRIRTGVLPGFPQALTATELIHQKRNILCSIGRAGGTRTHTEVSLHKSLKLARATNFATAR